MTRSAESESDPATVVSGMADTIGVPLDEASADARLTAKLGRYMVIEELGRGGMGLVLRAYDPKLQREVALKRLRTGTLAAAAHARLVREARAMARLSHPNVVAVYDVDIDEAERDGVVVVMEYVSGTNLRVWLTERERSLGEILRAFVDAGRGLCAAHVEGLLHRDFKLDNVMVGNDGRVRVTDFGLARATGTRTSDGASSGDEICTDDPDEPSDALTELGQVMGTPLYMAPEQMEGRDLDARADQYAFCVSLWFALTGRWPFRGQFAELLAGKRAGPPPWPSDRDVPSHVADALRRGLAARPQERWPSLADLLAELMRDPGRRRRRVAAVAAIALALTGVWGWQRLERVRTRAACVMEGESISEVWNETRANAIAAAFAATEITYAADTWARARRFLQADADAWQEARTQACEAAELGETWSPDLARASRACLDEHRDQLDALLDQLTRPDESVVLTAASASAGLPRVTTCIDPTALAQRAEPPDPAQRDEVAALRSRLAASTVARETGRYAEALEHAQAVLDGANAVGWPPLVAEAKLAVGAALQKLGRYEQARDTMLDAFHIALAAGRDELAARASHLLAFNIGTLLAQSDEGLRWAELAGTLVERLGESDDLLGAGVLATLGTLHDTRGEHADAVAAYERALAIYEEAVGTEHPSVATVLNNLGSVRYSRGEHAMAIALHQRALAIREATLGPEHPHVGASLMNLANVERDRGDYAAAIGHFERTVAIYEKTLGPEHPRFAGALDSLGATLVKRGEHGEALALHERALAIREKALGANHPDTALALTNLGIVHRALGDPGKALALHRRALEIRERALGAEHPDIAATLNNLSAVHTMLGQHVEAEASLRRALAILEKRYGPEHPSVATTLHNIGAALTSQGSYAEGLTYLERALASWEKAYGSDHPSVAMALENIGDAHEGQGEHAAAITAYERSLASRSHAEAGVPDLSHTRFKLARALWDSGGDRARARELAIATADAQRSLGTAGAEALATIETWLAEHPG